MQNSRKPFIVEIRSSRLKGKRVERPSIWGNADLAKATEQVEAQAQENARSPALPENPEQRPTSTTSGKPRF